MAAVVASQYVKPIVLKNTLNIKAMSLNVSQVRPREVRPSDGIVSIVKLCAVQVIMTRNIRATLGAKRILSNVNNGASTRSTLI